MQLKFSKGTTVQQEQQQRYNRCRLTLQQVATDFTANVDREPADSCSGTIALIYAINLNAHIHIAHPILCLTPASAARKH